MEPSLLTVYIIDNQPSFRYGLRQLLYETSYRISVREFATYDTTTRHAGETPDLIIIGLNNVDQLGRTPPDKARVLLFYDEGQKIPPLHRLPQWIGAVLHKNAEIEQIQRVVSRLLSTPVKNGKEDLNGRENTLFYKPLSAREFEIACYLTQGLKTSEISRLMQLKPSTVSTHKHRILTKTDTSNIIELRELMLAGHQRPHPAH